MLEEEKTRLDLLEANQIGIQNNINIINKRITKMSCRIDNIEEGYMKHLNSFHTKEVI